MLVTRTGASTPSVASDHESSASAPSTAFGSGRCSMMSSIITAPTRRPAMRSVNLPASPSPAARSTTWPLESSRHDVGHSISVTVPAHVLPAGVPEHLSHRCIATAQVEHDATMSVALDETHRVSVRAVPRERESIRRHVLGPGALAGLGLGRLRIGARHTLPRGRRRLRRPALQRHRAPRGRSEEVSLRRACPGTPPQLRDEARSR
jgi:hypothetical protein